MTATSSAMACAAPPLSTAATWKWPPTMLRDCGTVQLTVCTLPRSQLTALFGLVIVGVPL